MEDRQCRDLRRHAGNALQLLDAVPRPTRPRQGHPAHAGIYLLIAGTYTPFCLVTLRGPWGWSLFGVIWGLALVGIVLRIVRGRRSTLLSVGLYVGMGWAVVAAIEPMLNSVAPGGLLLLLLGGLAYTLGIVFYAWKRLPYHHAIWHGFVLAGSISHFFAILFYVIPLAAPDPGAPIGQR